MAKCEHERGLYNAPYVLSRVAEHGCTAALTEVADCAHAERDGERRLLWWRARVGGLNDRDRERIMPAGGPPYWSCGKPLGGGPPMPPIGPPIGGGPPPPAMPPLMKACGGLIGGPPNLEHHAADQHSNADLHEVRGVFDRVACAAGQLTWQPRLYCSVID